MDASGLLAMRAQDIRPLEGDTTQYVAGSQETFAQLNGSEAFMSNVGKAAGPVRTRSTRARVTTW